MRLPDESPIAAIATPPGRGGIGVVRVSGSGLDCVISGLLGEARAAALAPRHAAYGPFLAADGSEIDRGLALHFPAPHSYTGEDVFELQGHGGPVVMQLLLRRVLEAGAPIGLRLAMPGEFTQRAYLNEKLDLAQAEAVADLIDATTEQAARSATRSLAGEFSQEIHALVEQVIHLRMLVEATLDFPEEEIDFLERADAFGQLARIRATLAGVLARARQGALLREGLNVVLIGRPNVGKSSLLNALAGAEVAIVTPIAGTTRDRVAQAIQVEGVPLNVIDTAGLRDTADEVERIGIARTWDEVAKADVILHLQEAGQGGATAAAAAGARVDPNAVPGAGAIDADAIDAGIAARLPAGVPIVRVLNKIDLAGEGARVERVGGRPSAVWLSARGGEGVELLRAALLELAGWQGAGESQFIARERHLQALRAASDHLDAAEENARRRGEQLELFAEELRLAQEALSEITGEFTPDDLLGVIFSRFCIGK
ncbi:tRNA uridine-5-carboxymethylaminomethyl(34) synthesis GTPase MnmE [Quisquiliibacterium transsilvanicum]|uniref:tRNA modification GTPase MnmE n=1 Tax=Quisquiliibacterium transsilvanicum TaxID=1549638 RepID=A0A7W8M957_9BURK|nr:tRNA uridine-5-carboxymethylaminomethyl(34) synthesis GTPase MnmE [Quisquiliibacterium transsilvanicum]MBB5272711.1 tRNA modification GTPase [Quisquiliibacterium transsilvanicum]